MGIANSNQGKSCQKQSWADLSLLGIKLLQPNCFACVGNIQKRPSGVDVLLVCQRHIGVRPMPRLEQFDNKKRGRGEGRGGVSSSAVMEL